MASGRLRALLPCGFLLPGSVARADTVRPQGAPVKIDGRAALQKAALLVQQGRLEEADEQARLALSDQATRAVAYSVLGAIRFQQKRLPESASFLQKAIQPQPRLLGAHLSLAQVYTLQGKSEMVLYIQGRLAEAAERLSESARLQPEQLASHYYLALVARDRGHDAEAIAILGKLVQRYDHGPVVRSF